MCLKLILDIVIKFQLFSDREKFSLKNLCSVDVLTLILRKILHGINKIRYGKFIKC